MNRTELYNHWRRQKKAIRILESFGCYDQYQKRGCVRIPLSTKSPYTTPEEIFSLEEIKTLDISQAKERILPEEVYQMKKLEKLKLRKEQIEEGLYLEKAEKIGSLEAIICVDHLNENEHKAFKEKFKNSNIEFEATSTEETLNFDMVTSSTKEAKEKEESSQDPEKS